MRKLAMSMAAAALGLGLGLGTSETAQAQSSVEYATISSQSTSTITGSSRRASSRGLYQSVNTRFRGAGSRGQLNFNRSNFRNAASGSKFASVATLSRVEDRRKHTGQLCETVEAGVRVMRPRCR